MKDELKRRCEAMYLNSQNFDFIDSPILEVVGYYLTVKSKNPVKACIADISETRIPSSIGKRVLVYLNNFQ